jgi:hypothetical protein
MNSEAGQPYIDWEVDLIPVQLKYNRENGTGSVPKLLNVVNHTSCTDRGQSYRRQAT